MSYRLWSGSPTDELQALSGHFDNSLHLKEVKEGLMIGDDAILYYQDTPEYRVIKEMWAVAEAAGRYYDKTGRYPGLESDQRQLKEPSLKLSYKNPITGEKSSVPITEASGGRLENSNGVEKNSFEKAWEQGALFDPKLSPGPGLIYCCRLGLPPVAEEGKHGGSMPESFYVEGFDRDGHRIRGLHGKSFLIVLKKGVNCTQDTAPSLAPATTKQILDTYISRDDGFNKPWLFLKYLLLVTICAGVLIALARRHALVEWYKNGR